jgi:lipoate---protein ligase
MQLRDISFPNPTENILFDEVLWRLAEKHEGGEFLRFWESSEVFIVLGRAGQAQEDVNLVAAQKDNIPVLRRSSGGGTVVQGPGCLNYTLVLSKQKYPVLNDLRQSYQWIGAKVIEALRQTGVDAYFRPTSDLATGAFEQKFSGNAQRRGRHYILHHGTILYSFDLNLISRYLNMPSDIPQYRKHRPHTDFVINIPTDPASFKNHLAQGFKASALQYPSLQEFAFLKKFIK